MQREVIMSDSEWYEVAEGEHYRHKLSGVLVRVTRVRQREGITGLVRWEALDGGKIEGAASQVQEAQHFLEDFDCWRRSPAVAA
jgi:hypothetical protein